ncbi:N-acetylglucosamine-6-phosphate deacetylase, partial [gut metagenome]
MDLAAGRVVKIDIAPERKGATEFTAKAVELGAIVSLGHSSATYDEAKACVDAGATVFIHTYNAMSPLNHRMPGMVGCAFATPGTYAELICDGHHVHPIAAEIA